MRSHRSVLFVLLNCYIYEQEINLTAKLTNILRSYSSVNMMFRLVIKYLCNNPNVNRQSDEPIMC
jgi:hypothetical protein